MTLSQPVFALTAYCCMLTGEATNTNLNVFCLTKRGIEPTIYRTREEHSSRPTLWDPEAWTVMGTPSHPATIRGQHPTR